MGKTKIALIDDSALKEEISSKKKVKDSKKEQAKAESKTTISSESEARGDGEEGSRRVAAANEVSEDARRDTEPAGPRAVEKKGQKPGKTKPRSKKYQEARKLRDQNLPAGRQAYPIPEAVDMVKKLNYAKFNATIEAHINTAAFGIRGLVSLPFASGKKLRILVFGRLPEPSEYEGVVFGDDSTIESISQGKVDFDLVITTPEWMPKLAKVAKVLGPKGLMPNPKNGTITEDLKKAVEGFQAGKTEYKTEPKAPVIHLALGKLDQPTEELSANIKTLLSTLGKTRVKKVSLSPTMGPSVKVDLSSL